MRLTLLPLSSARSVVVILGAILLALALVLAGALAPKQADAATRIVTKTFSNSGQILIPDCTNSVSPGPATPYPSQMSVGAFPSGSHIRDVNLADAIAKKYLGEKRPEGHK